MILYLEFRNGRQRLGLVGGGRAAWLRRRQDRGEFAALSAAGRQFGLARRRPTAVVAAVFPQGAPDVSWSTVRTAVAMANALAFAWDVPAVGMNPDGLDDEALLKAIAAAAKKARRGARLAARYSGEPHITKPRK